MVQFNWNSRKYFINDHPACNGVSTVSTPVFHHLVTDCVSPLINTHHCQVSIREENTLSMKLNHKLRRIIACTAQLCIWTILWLVIVSGEERSEADDHSWRLPAEHETVPWSPLETLHWREESMRDQRHWWVTMVLIMLPRCSTLMTIILRRRHITGDIQRNETM